MATKHIEKKKGRRYSVVLLVFWFTQSVITYLGLRSYLFWWQQHKETSRASLHDAKLLIYSVEFALVAFSLVLACCSETSAQGRREKSKAASKSQCEKPGEQTAGMFSYLTFWWTN